jgi:hypothetical protein
MKRGNTSLSQYAVKILLDDQIDPPSFMVQLALFNQFLRGVGRGGQALLLKSHSGPNDCSAA